MKKLTLFAVLAFLLIAITSASSPQVLGGPQVVDRQLTDVDLVLIFTLRQSRWPTSGQPVRVIVYDPQSPYQVDFLYSILGMSEWSYEAQLSRNLYSGRAQPPLRVKTPEEMLQKLEASPNGVGYVRDSLMYNSGTGLVVIRIIR